MQGLVQGHKLTRGSPTCSRLSEASSGNFPAGPAVKNPPATAGDIGSTPSPGRVHVSRGN